MSKCVIALVNHKITVMETEPDGHFIRAATMMPAMNAKTHHE